MVLYALIFMVCDMNELVFEVQILCNFFQEIQLNQIKLLTCYKDFFF